MEKQQFVSGPQTNHGSFGGNRQRSGSQQRFLGNETFPAQQQPQQPQQQSFQPSANKMNQNIYNDGGVQSNTIKPLMSDLIDVKDTVTGSGKVRVAHQTKVSPKSKTLLSNSTSSSKSKSGSGKSSSSKSSLKSSTNNTNSSSSNKSSRERSSRDSKTSPSQRSLSSSNDRKKSSTTRRSISPASPSVPKSPKKVTDTKVSSTSGMNVSPPATTKFKDVKTTSKSRNYMRRNRESSKSPLGDNRKDIDLRDLKPAAAIDSAAAIEEKKPTTNSIPAPSTKSTIVTSTSDVKDAADINLEASVLGLDPMLLLPIDEIVDKSKEFSNIITNQFSTYEVAHMCFSFYKRLIIFV